MESGSETRRCGPPHSIPRLAFRRVDAYCVGLPWPARAEPVEVDSLRAHQLRPCRPRPPTRQPRREGEHRGRRLVLVARAEYFALDARADCAIAPR